MIADISLFIIMFGIAIISFGVGCVYSKHQLPDETDSNEYVKIPTDEYNRVMRTLNQIEEVLRK